jgi:hypothetical protein
VRVARLRGSAREVADRSDLLAEIGEDHIQLTVAEAVRAADAELFGPPVPGSVAEDPLKSSDAADRGLSPGDDDSGDGK